MTSQLIMRTCTSCGQTKPRAKDFVKVRGPKLDYKPVCRECEAREKTVTESGDPRKKVCAGPCGETKSLRDFYSSSRGTLKTECKVCTNAAKTRNRKQVQPAPATTGTNPWDWRTYRSQIDWNGNTRYVPTEVASKHYRGYVI